MKFYFGYMLLTMDICQKDKDVLRTVKMYLHIARPLVINKTNKGKAVKLLKTADADLETVRDDIVKLDTKVGELAVTLEELKRAHGRINTSVVINLKTKRPSARKTLEELECRHAKFSKILNYYCHLYMTLYHQVEGQRLANEMKMDGHDGLHDMLIDDDAELRRKAIVAGPHVRKMLQEFIDSKNA
jgi:hypothetical protein